MGYQHGKLLEKMFPETEAAFKEIMPPIPLGAIGRWIVKQYVMYRLDGIEKYLYKEEIEELQGIAESKPEKKGGYRDLLYYHSLQDIGQNFACTGGAAVGHASKLKGPVAGRNFDYGRRGILDSLKTVFYCRPEHGPSYVSVAWPGMAGAMSGMNDRGLCVMVFSAKSEGVSISGVPVAFIAKRVLKHAVDIPQALDIIKRSKRMGPDIFLLVDKKRAAAVEFDSGHVGVREISDGRLPVANQFLTEEFAQDWKNREEATYGDTRQRYGRMAELLDRAVRIGVKDMLASLRDHDSGDKAMAWGDPAAISNYKNAHSVIFDPAGLKVWVSTAPYAYGKFIGFRMTPAGLERIKPLPADWYVNTDSAKSAKVSDDLMVRAEAAGNPSVSPEARLLIEKALEVAPSNYLAALKIGLACQDDYHYEDARKAFDRAVSSAPAGSIVMAKALAGRGEALLKLGRKDEAKADLKAVLALDCCKEANEKAERGLSRM